MIHSTADIMTPFQEGYQCYCTDKFYTSQSSLQASYECFDDNALPCSGDNTQMCGSLNATAVYRGMRTLYQSVLQLLEKEIFIMACLC